MRRAQPRRTRNNSSFVLPQHTCPTRAPSTSTDLDVCARPELLWETCPAALRNALPVPADSPTVSFARLSEREVVRLEVLLVTARRARVGSGPVPLDHTVLARHVLRELVPHRTRVATYDVLADMRGLATRKVPPPGVHGIDRAALEVRLP